MARPKKYDNAAQKQAAYRANRNATTVVVDRQAMNLLHTRLDNLQRAIRAATTAGDPTAGRCWAASIDTLLDNLAQHFEDQSSPKSADTKETEKNGTKQGSKPRHE